MDNQANSPAGKINVPPQLLPKGPVVVGSPWGEADERGDPQGAVGQKTAHYVLSSHWDREWHHTFQRFRIELVDMLDGIIDSLNDGSLPGPFVCDGHAVLLEDYLEVRPERKDEVTRLLNEGKLVAGPWYTLPDELVIGGESLIRNLMLGRKAVRELGGKPSDAGFLCDLFGHNSQMPQIMAGFGMPFGFIWRGTNIHDQRHLLWRGADGTELPCHRFGKNGYWGFGVNVRDFTEHGNAGPTDQAFKENLTNTLKQDFDESATDHVLLFDGADHATPDMRAIRQLMDVAGSDDLGCTIKFGSLDDYAHGVLSQADRIQTVIQGELLETAKHPLGVDDQWLVINCGSSRVYLKYANDHCESLLCHWAEPMAVWSHLLTGQRPMQDLIEDAWRMMLQNHTHDSICGCSSGAVHDYM